MRAVVASLAACAGVAMLAVTVGGVGGSSSDDRGAPGGAAQGPLAFANPYLFDAGSRRTTRGHADLSVLASDPTSGNPSAPVTIVVFSDFQCPFCGRLQPTLKSLQASYPGNLRLVWKDYPLPFHDKAKPAAIAARTVFLARGATAFWGAHDALFARQQQLPDAIRAIYADAGIDDVTAARLAPEATRLVEDGILLAGELGISGTPSCAVDGELLVGAQPTTAFSEMIDRHLSEARGLLAAGTPLARLYDAMLARHTARDAGP